MRSEKDGIGLLAKLEKNILDIEMKDMNYGFWDMIRRWKFLHCPVALCSYEFLY